MNHFKSFFTLQYLCISAGPQVFATIKVKNPIIWDLLPCRLVNAYLLTPRCRVLLEQLTGLRLVKKFPAFHGTRRFITALTSVRQLSLSWASPIQSIYPHHTSCRSILTLSAHLRLGLSSGLFPPTLNISTKSRMHHVRGAFENMSTCSLISSSTNIKLPSTCKIFSSIPE